MSERPKSPCSLCAGTGWYGENGAGIPGNAEIIRCDCGQHEMCTSGHHPYRMLEDVPWCVTCGREADMSVCRVHRIPAKHPTCETCGHNRSYPKQSWCELWRCVFPRPHYCASHTDLEKDDV